MAVKMEKKMSIVASQYDPVDWLLPVIIKFRIAIQALQPRKFVGY